MSDMTGHGIPRSLAPFLPEYVIDQVDPERASHTLIERTLRYANRAEIRWLFQRYGEPAIAEWVRLWGARTLPRPHRAFWRVVLSIGDEA